MSSTSVAGSLRGAHLLVTGVTGFVGKVWLAMLLDRIPEIGRVTVLVRGRRGESGRARFVASVERCPAFRPLRAKYGSRLPDLIAERVRVVEGDVSEPGCGLDPVVTAEFAGEIDVVVHFAGLTDFDPDPKLAFETNVLGAVHVAGLAARTHGKRLVHVSTTFVAGLGSGEVAEQLTVGISPLGKRFDPHNELDALRSLCARTEERSERGEAAQKRASALGWPNIYTYTKGLGEHLLAAQTNIRTTIARPSIVECAVDYPFAGWNEGINTSGPLVWLLGSWFRRLPISPKHHFDVIPVDTACRGLITIVARALTDSAAPIYHLASSDKNPMNFDRAIELTALAVRKHMGRPEASALERLVIRYLDPKARSHADRDPFPTLPSLRKLARGGRDILKRLEPKEILPPALYDRYGQELEGKLRTWSQECRNADRMIGRIEEMLRLYKPFIQDNDYVFRTGHIARLTEELDPAERALFGFNIDQLDWRRYWVDVEVPGLMKWCIPLLKNEQVPDDPEPEWNVYPKARAVAAHSIAGGNGASRMQPPEVSP